MITSSQRILLYTLLIISLSWAGQMQLLAQGNTTHQLRLKNGVQGLQANAAHWLDSVNNSGASGAMLIYIHFNTLPDAAQRATMKKNGISLLDYIPDNTFSAVATPPFNTSVITALPVYAIVNVQTEWKADERTWKKLSTEKGYVDMLVSFYPFIDAATAKQFIAAAGAQINAGPMERYGAYRITIAAGSVHSIASWYGVKYISPATSMAPLDLQSRPAVKGNIAVNPTTAGGYGLNGDSVTVGVGDNGSAIYHADLKDRVLNFNPASLGNVHGEHVNGIVGGAGTIDPMAEGMATHVTLADYLYDQVVAATGTMYTDHHMTITNNSYGVILNDCDYSGTYDAYAQFVDTLAMEYPEVLHVFASGNDGYDVCSPYPLSFGTVAGGYQPAKNNVVVGSMTDGLDAAVDESRGPAKDGRLKPEIVAVGLGAYSTVGIDGYEWDAGTSMASPQVSGGLALLTQRYKQLNGTQPKADELKAILLNGAMDRGNPGPDFTYGFGTMDLHRSLGILDSSWYSSNTLNNNDSQTINITIPSNTAQLKVLLCWADRPASPSSAIALVNDLDLTVQAPSGTIRLPLVADGTPANVTHVATEQADHLNNVEQVTILHPAAGNYAVKVKGYNVPFAAQRYVLAWDMMPDGVQLTYPNGGEAWENTDTLRIFWEAVSDTNTFTIDFSADNGGSWTTLSANVPSWRRYYGWMPTGINSGSCKMRIKENSTSSVSVSGTFAINTIPVVHLDTAQCPGYIALHWSPVPNATAYQLLSKTGNYMQPVATITDTAYIFSGMSTTAKSYVAIRPLMGATAGYRSVAAVTTANTGNCLNPVSAGDLMLSRINAPHSGRMFTSTQLTNAETLSVDVRNLSSVACSSYAMHYNINGGPWQVYTSGLVIPANSTLTISIPGIDLSDTGSYNFTVVVEDLALTDPVPSNDTLQFTVLNIPNHSLALPFADGFENMNILSVSHDSIGLSPDGHWDFHSNDSFGRMRSFVNSSVTIDGSRSVSLDENQAVANGSHNLFTGTFNLAAYDTGTSEVRLDFDYVLHGTPKTASGNQVLARASDTQPWSQLYVYDLNAYPGTLNHARSLSLTDLVRSGLHNFSNSTQVSFGQNDTSLIAAADFGNGITLDDVKLYTVANDAQLVQVISPLPSNCGLPAAQPLTVQVHNGVNYTLHNVQLFYQADGGNIWTGAIDSVAAKATVNYTFAHTIDLSSGPAHSVNIWLSTAGDTYQPNDSILNYKFRNSNIYSTFPYLENFENGDGGYYSDGVNNSWQYGTPAAAKISKAASGTKAWKTNLTGHYKNLELSYLYSPCFDISSLSSPMLSFSMAQDIENCGNVMCDQGYVEYTFDGSAWAKLGAAGQGTNWYDSAFDVWNTNGFTRWHVASIPLPQPPAGETIHFRFVLHSDPGANFEGIAIDDIHIFDLAHSIFPANGITVVNTIAPAGTWTGLTTDNALVASVLPPNTFSTAITLYAHDTLFNTGATQYTLPRSYSIHATGNAGDSIGVRLYLTENEFVRTLEHGNCPSCTITDAYSLGVTQYTNTADPAAENGTLADNVSGQYYYYPHAGIQWVPYDKGYYAQLKTTKIGELWFNDGGPTGNFPAGTDYLNFAAQRQGNDALLQWYALTDTATGNYQLQRSLNGTDYTTILDTAAMHLNPGTYAYTDKDIFPQDTAVYYRLSWNLTGSTGTFYAPVRKLTLADSAQAQIVFDAEMNGTNAVLADWTSYLDGTTTSYKLERQINDGDYKQVYTVNAERHYGQHYAFRDLPVNLARGTQLHYRLTAITDDGRMEVLPVRTVIWGSAGYVSNVFPNPNNDGNITINWHASAGTVMNLNIIDINGVVRYTGTAKAGPGNNTTQLQTFHRPRGTYLLRMEIGGQVYTTSLVYQ